MMGLLSCKKENIRTITNKLEQKLLTQSERDIRLRETISPTTTSAISSN
jgi:hypothetical protein